MLPFAALLVLAAASAWHAAPAATAQSATLDEVLERAGNYVSAYATRFASLVAEERSVQRSHSNLFSADTSREIRSDFLVVRVASSSTWIGFRDVFEVNGVPVRDRQDRLLKLFVETPETAVERAQRIANESARHNIGDLKRNFNLPTTALFFLLPSSQSRLRFKHAGDQTLDGVRYWVVKGEEIQTPTYIHTTTGREVKVTVEYWIDPSSGRLAQSEMRLSEPVRTIITVDYRFNEKLDMWAPREMREFYEQGDTRITCVATYSNFRRFQVSTDSTFRDAP
jgi:hypothetical protein